ncbi:3-dehydroquinate synthase [Prochlorococcus marinus]|uniref:3-dehydroquinate synthase n=1 Tax=Prochlorococcus marinus XMU1408 TaxID=2213228 RepID=A0A318R1Q8_PROMR|nr:3-dehydroquinate synthase [Prochlorococcus marinus]MBW3041708.1 3-dehydroquinate synthase [Prochlorococcus marinus str. XMU1408]PYE02855.1 3-dehydroquinate synthase [Prochlorococcus marinus XMU1408]
MNKDYLNIKVSLTNNPYNIIIGKNSLECIGDELSKIGFKKGLKVLVVSNKEVSDHYGDIVINSLIKSNYNPKLFILRAGEEQKNQSSIGLIHDAAYEARLERGSLMIALGGGVIGDMTGFAAATWLRGIHVVQIPTTLLAMVDASIGGKTGINHSKGKNLIGAFHQPKLVLIDPKTLVTLPGREFKAGMAEIIKYGVISDLELFELLENQDLISELSKIKEKLLIEIIKRSAKSKADIVIKDEKESGVRAFLNYGHTFGHVIENLCGYGKWLHGEAVAMGMVAVGQLAVQRGLWKEIDAKRQKRLIEKAGLPTDWPGLKLESVLSSLQGDKKVKNGKVSFVLPVKIGDVKIFNNISNQEIDECLQKLKLS